MCYVPHKAFNHRHNRKVYIARIYIDMGNACKEINCTPQSGLVDLPGRATSEDPQLAFLPVLVTGEQVGEEEGKS